ncbi:MAG: hypothetical protein ACFFFB_19810 [Candidatus Heimdallarchaeota archaeon]
MEQIVLSKKESEVTHNHIPEHKLITCDVCNEEIRYRAAFYDSGVNHRVICELCYRKFSKEDIELMLNLFNAYGGYYGKFKKLKSSIYKRLKEFNEFDLRNNNFSNTDQINLQLLHGALIFGFTPEEYFQGVLIHD